MVPGQLLFGTYELHTVFTWLFTSPITVKRRLTWIWKKHSPFFHFYLGRSFMSPVWFKWLDQCPAGGETIPLPLGPKQWKYSLPRLTLYFTVWVKIAMPLHILGRPQKLMPALCYGWEKKWSERDIWHGRRAYWAESTFSIAKFQAMEYITLSEQNNSKSGEYMLLRSQHKKAMRHTQEPRTTTAHRNKGLPATG